MIGCTSSGTPRWQEPATPTFHMPIDHPKGWGKEVWLASTDRYCGKLLCFNAGARFSAHFHDLKDETFYILSGRVLFSWTNPHTAETTVTEMARGQVVDIPRLCVHQVEALEESVVIEVSSPHREDDSYRVRPGDTQKAAPSVEMPVPPDEIVWTNLIYHPADYGDHPIGDGVWREVLPAERALHPKRQYYTRMGKPIGP